MQVIILMGVSGAGKSTYAKKLVEGNNGVVVSADDYFMVKGEYKFDPSRLSEAHGQCFRTFINELADRDFDLMMVDNTNTSAVEIAPYVLGAQAYGWPVKVVHVRCPIGVALERAIHGAPSHAIAAMAARIEKTTKEMPPWWQFEEVDGL